MGGSDYLKAADFLYAQIFPWWREASKRTFLNTRPFSWTALARGEIWKQATSEWKDLTGGLPALHRFDGKGWYVAATAAGTPVEWGEILSSDVQDRVLAWVLSLQAGRTRATRRGEIPDTAEKIPAGMPDNPDVRDLCQLLQKNRRKISSKAKTRIDIAREFTREKPGKDSKAQSLLRQARRYSRLWDSADN